MVESPPGRREHRVNRSSSNPRFPCRAPPANAFTSICRPGRDRQACFQTGSSIQTNWPHRIEHRKSPRRPSPTIEFDRLWNLMIVTAHAGAETAPHWPVANRSPSTCTPLRRPRRLTNYPLSPDDREFGSSGGEVPLLDGLRKRGLLPASTNQKKFGGEKPGKCASSGAACEGRRDWC